ncbi:MAG: hypothetical protein EBR82_17805 [Caulobacteraceae bacterium]|nr:hypothetical protein [Caulobacteraceae bacterium]
MRGFSGSAVGGVGAVAGTAGASAAVAWAGTEGAATPPVWAGVVWTRAAAKASATASMRNSELEP